MTGQHGGNVALADDGDYGTGAYIAASIVQDEAVAAGLIAAHGHARTRTPRFARLARLLRKDGPAPVSPLAADQPGEFTQAVNAHESPVTGEGALARPVPAVEVVHEDAGLDTRAFRPEEIPDDLITYPAPDPRRYVPDAVAPAACSWGTWDDEPGQPEPMRPAPAYAWDLRADFRDLPLFKSTVRAACKAGLRGLGARGADHVVPPPDYGLHRFTVVPGRGGFDPAAAVSLAAAYVENDFYEADRIFHTAGSAGSRAGSAGFRSVTA